MQKTKTHKTFPAKLLALWLSVVMIATLFTVPVFADDTETQTCKVTVTNSAAAEEGNALQVYDNDSFQDVTGEATFDAGTVITCYVQAYGSDVKLTIVHNGETAEETVSFGDTFEKDITLAGDLSITAEVAPKEEPETFSVSYTDEANLEDVVFNVVSTVMTDDGPVPMPVNNGDMLEKGSMVGVQVINSSDKWLKLTQYDAENAVEDVAYIEPKDTEESYGGLMVFDREENISFTLAVVNMYKVSVKNNAAIANTEYGVNALHVSNMDEKDWPDLEDGAMVEEGTNLWIYPYNYVTPVQFTVKQGEEVLFDKTVPTVLDGGYEEYEMVVAGNVEVTSNALCTISIDNKVTDSAVTLIANSVDPEAESPEATPISDGSIVYGGHMVGATVINDSDKMLKLTAVNPALGTTIDEVLIKPADAFGIIIDELKSDVKFTLEETAETVPITDAKLEYASKTYTGKQLKPAVTVTAKVNGQPVTLKAGTDYDVVYSNNINAGKATVKITGKGSYSGTISKNFTITKAAQNLKVTQKKNQKTLSVKLSKLGKKGKGFAFSKAAKVSGNKTKLTYNKTKGNKKITVNAKNGKITVKKGIKAGTYKVSVLVSAAANNNYNGVSKTVNVTVKVK